MCTSGGSSQVALGAVRTGVGRGPHRYFTVGAANNDADREAFRERVSAEGGQCLVHNR